MNHQGADAGIIVASGDFTDDAREFARATSIELVNGEKLQTLLGYARGESEAVGPRKMFAVTDS